MKSIFNEIEKKQLLERSRELEKESQDYLKNGGIGKQKQKNKLQTTSPVRFDEDLFVPYGIGFDKYIEDKKKLVETQKYQNQKVFLRNIDLL